MSVCGEGRGVGSHVPPADEVAGEGDPEPIPLGNAPDYP